MIDLLSYEFMRHAFIAGTLAAIIAGMVGYFAIIRHLAFAAHALGHIGFAGASGALLIGMTPLTGQFILTVIAAIGMGALGERISKSDMAIGIVLSFCLGLGTLFLYLYHGFAGQASVILFGNLLGVSGDDLKIMAWLTVISVVGLSLITRPLFFASLEPELAEAKGISLFWIGIAFIVLMAIAVTLASQVVGVILVFTLLVGPAAIAVHWTHRFWSGILMSTVLALLVVWIGISLSYYTDWPISFWISFFTFVLYLGSGLIKKYLF